MGSDAIMRIQVSDLPNGVGRELVEAGITNAVKVKRGWDVFCPEDKVGDVIATLGGVGVHFYGVDPVRPDPS